MAEPNPMLDGPMPAPSAPAAFGVNSRVKFHNLARKLVWLPILALLVSGITILSLNAEQRHLALPALVAINIAIGFVSVLWIRDNAFPLVDLGTFTVLTTALYCALPLLRHLAAGMVWTTLSDYRMFAYAPTPAEYGDFGWYGVAYLASLALAYVITRGRTGYVRRDLRTPNSRIVVAAVILLLFSGTWYLGLKLFTGLDLSNPYDESYSENIANPMTTLPKVVWQITLHLSGAALVGKMILIMALLARWRSRLWRAVLVLWVAMEFLLLMGHMNARTPLAQLLVVGALLFDRMIRPLSGKMIIFGGTMLLVALLAYGIMRNRHLLGGSMPTDESELTHVTEFDVLFANGYDVNMRNSMGTLSKPPWQFYFVDILALIPNQLLPFDKVDPSVWYMEELGATDLGITFMWGAVAQAMIGFGYVELIVRGAVLGVLFALVHRWYRKRQSSWIVTLFYLFMCLFSYWTYRATTFSFLVLAEYMFLAGLLLVYGIAFFVPLRSRNLVHKHILAASDQI